MTEHHETTTEHPPVDEGTYEATQPHLKAALEYTIAMGRSVRDWGEFCLEKFGSTILPYLKRFLLDVREQRVRIDGLGDGARNALFGTALTADERERWVQERAYFRAEQRGFTGGSAEEDWIESEREVDRWIAQQMGVVGRGREAVLSLGELAHKGFDGMRDMLTHWMEQRTSAERRQAD